MHESVFTEMGRGGKSGHGVNGEMPHHYMHMGRGAPRIDGPTGASGTPGMGGMRMREFEFGQQNYRKHNRQRDSGMAGPAAVWLQTEASLWPQPEAWSHLLSPPRRSYTRSVGALRR